MKPPTTDTRVLVPFALAEYNQNCTHNGEMTFLFNPQKLRIFRTSLPDHPGDLCLLVRQLLRNLAATYTPSTIANDTTIENNEAAEIKNRIPAEPFANWPQTIPIPVSTLQLYAGLSQSGGYYWLWAVHQRDQLCQHLPNALRHIRLLLGNALPSYSVANPPLSRPP